MQRSHLCLALAAVLTTLAAGCSGTRATAIVNGNAEAQVSLDGRTYLLRDVSLTLEAGDDPWFRIDGEPVSHADEDCVVGLSGGMGLYGDLPASVQTPADLLGRKLRVDFSGDGDDANFCFVGMGGLAGAEDAFVTITAVDGDRVTFAMSGTFRIYDENGDGPVKRASAAGQAVLRRES
jgi:hypothetical protein